MLNAIKRQQGRKVQKGIKIQNFYEGANTKLPCNKCDYIATFRGNLLQHLKSRHEGVEFPCDKCVKTYKVKSQTGLKLDLCSMMQYP